MKKPVAFAAFWFVNSIVLYLAAMFFGEVYELGTAKMGVLTSALVSGFIWTIFVIVTKKLLRKFKVVLKKEPERILFYVVANFVSLWLVARIAPYSGFGSSSFVWVLGLAVFASLVQFAVWRLIRRK